MTVSAIVNIHTDMPQTLNELIKLDDEPFVRAAYRIVLRREADQEGFAYYLRRTQSGINKLHTLRQLRFSPEGQAISPSIANLDKALRVYQFKRFFGLESRQVMNRQDTAPPKSAPSRHESDAKILELERVVRATNTQIANLALSLKHLNSESRYTSARNQNVETDSITALVSIVTPAYKTEPYYLERLTTSLWPFRNSIEWVIVNDSPDASHIDVFAEKIKQCFPNIQYVRHERNMGIFSAYTSGISASTAPYVAILDHDDEVDLTRVIAHLKKNDVQYDCIYTDEVRFGQNLVVNYEKPEFDPLSAMHYFYMHHITLFRTNICKHILTSKSDAANRYRSCFDIWLAFNYVRYFHGNQISSRYIPGISYGWRVHDQSTAKDLGQKPLADSERIDIARSLYEPLDSRAEIHLDQEIRYLIRYTYPINTIQDREEFLDGIRSHYDIISTDGSPVSHVDFLRDENPLINALHGVPIAYLSEFAPGKCTVIPRQTLLENTELHSRMARHLDGVPVLVVDRDLSPLELDHAKRVNIGTLISNKMSKLHAEHASQHFLIV